MGSQKNPITKPPLQRTKVSLVIEFAEDTNVLESETAAYPMSALLSDVGGAAGLVLGLNALEIAFKSRSLLTPRHPFSPNRAIEYSTAIIHFSMEFHSFPNSHLRHIL